MTSELSWLHQLKRTYIGNATATRDFRIQLRGSRAAVLFTLYLVLMAFVLLMVYSSSIGEEGRYSLATAQSSLQTFYYVTLGALGIVISIVAPSMGAFAIVTEKQRRSLDLVFSAPTEPKYYLVGKLISSYRYVWLLLVLSLPFCAVSVTLGGTTWGQLFITFLLFSVYGLVCVSFGLLLSTLCSKALPAIIWTYLSIGCYFVGTFMLLALSAFSGHSSPLTQVNPFSSLNPFTFPFVSDQTWPVFGREVPTWILSIILQLLVVKFVILSAGSLLAPGNSKEIRGLRIHGLVYTAAITYLIGFTIDPSFRSTFTGGPEAGMSLNQVLQIYHGRSIFSILFFIGLIVVPYLASFGFNDLRRHRPNGFFNIKHTFSGRPAGHLPYLIVLFLVCVIAYVWGVRSAANATSFIPFSRSSSSITPETVESLNPFSKNFLMYLLITFDLWVLGFLIGWFVCSRTPILSRGRTFALFFFVLGIILPTALFAIISPEDYRTATGLWAFNPVAGAICELSSAGITGIHGLALLCLCVIVAALTVPNVMKQSSRNLEAPKQPSSEIPS